MAIDMYLAGRTSAKMDQFLYEKGCNHLFSQLYERKGINQWIENSVENGKKGKIFIDSGAYTAYTKGKELDVDEYIDFLNSNTENLDLFAQVDKIPGQHGKPKTLEEILEAPRQSWNNYLYMRPKMKEPDKLLPIFHRRESFEWLELMLETTFDNKHIPYIGIAATTDSTVKEKKNWFDQVFNIIRKSSNPNVKTHAFGMTSFKLLEAYPWTSADSTSWIQCGANGSIFTKWGVLLVSDWQMNDPDNIIHMGEGGKEVIKYIESFGYTVEMLASKAFNRWGFNGLMYDDWGRNIHQYKGGKMHRRPLF